MTVYAITDTKKGRTGIAPTYLQVGAGAAFINTGSRDMKGVGIRHFLRVLDHLPRIIQHNLLKMDQHVDLQTGLFRNLTLRTESFLLNLITQLR